MSFVEGDVLVLRCKKINTMLFSAISQNLDNHCALVVRYKGKLQIIDFFVSKIILNVFIE